MMKLFVLITYCILAIHINYSRAQSYSSVHYDTKDGLPSSTVYDISQDKNGFIWFATENGLCRFDGKNFKTFTTKDGLPDNSVLNVHGDNSGRVYFTPFTHSLYYYQDGNFIKVSIPDKYKVDLSTISLFINKKDKVILSGLTDSYILENDSLISFREKYKKYPKNVFIKRVYDTLIIAGSEDSLFFIPDSGKIRSYVYHTTKELNEIFDENAKRRQLNCTEKFDFAPGKYLSANLLYLNLDNFVNIFNTSTGNLIHKIKVDKFSNAFMDNENNLWIASLGDGVYRFPSFGFRNISFGGKNEIFSLIKTDHQLIAGTGFSKMYGLPFENTGSRYSTTDLSTLIAASGNPVTHSLKETGYLYYAPEETIFILEPMPSC